MAKGDDAVLKKKGKAVRKRQRRDAAGSEDSARAVQAAKRRQKLGKRRVCEGMCFTLPTPEDPFNDRNDPKRRNKDTRKAREKKVPALLEFETSTDAEHDLEFDIEAACEKQPKRRIDENTKADTTQIAASTGASGNAKVENGAVQHCRTENVETVVAGELSFGNECDSFGGEVIDDASLGEILEAGLLGDDFCPVKVMTRGSKAGMGIQGPLLGRQCLEALSTGVDVLCASSLEWKERFLGYIVPAAAHVKQQRRNQSMLQSPLVLVTVASRQQALQVRRLLKPLKKPLAISSVCVHEGTSFETQKTWLSLRPPDVVVATPRRLLELAALNAVCLSSVSLLVVDGLSDIVRTGCLSEMIKLKGHLSQGARKIIVSDRFPEDAVTITRQLVSSPISRTLVEASEFERSAACVTQEVSVFTSVSKKLPKMLKILQQFREKDTTNEDGGALVLVDSPETVEELVPVIESKDFVTAGISSPEGREIGPILEKFRERHVQVIVTTEGAVWQVPLSKVTLVIIYCFPTDMVVYRRILTSMARLSAHGALHSLCTPSMAPLARDLEDVLKCCSQEVPRALQMLGEAASVVQSGIQRKKKASVTTAPRNGC